MDAERRASAAPGSRSEVRAKASRRGCRPMFGQEARPLWPTLSAPYYPMMSILGACATAGSAMLLRILFVFC